jgi:peptidoglycan/LPS O-acetylase OafA/YrhL
MHGHVTTVNQSSLERFPALDGVRGVAIVLVLFHHLWAFGPTPRTHFEIDAAKVLSLGWTGVELFFVLSGFLITRILLASRHEPNPFRRFFIGRALRILPVYTLFVVVFCQVLPWMFPTYAPLAVIHNDFAWYATFTINVLLFLRDNWFSPLTHHTWSLCIEEQFYLLWPFIVLSCRADTAFRISLLTILFSVSLRFLMALHGYGEVAIRAATPAHLDGLMAGSLLAIVLSNRLLEEARLTATAWVLLLVGTLGSMTFLLGWIPSAEGLQLFRLFSTLVFLAVVICCVLSPSSTIARSLSVKPLTMLGKYSYSLYLFHQPIYVIFMQHAIPALNVRSAFVAWLLCIPFAAIPSFALSVISFEKFEKRFLDFKKRLLKEATV